MDNTNKIDTIKAIDKLIFNYKNGINEHGFSTCPLCQLYISDDSKSCGKCPNIVFVIGVSKGCHQRGRDFKLNYGTVEHVKYLIPYWKKVRAFLNKRPAAAVRALSEGTRSGILEIAENYKF